MEKCGFCFIVVVVFWLFGCVGVCFLFGVFLLWFLVVGVVFGGFQDFSRFSAITQDFFNLAIGEFWVVFCLRACLLIF